MRNNNSVSPRRRMVGDRDSNRGSSHDIDNQIQSSGGRNNNFNQRHKSQAPTRNV